MHPLRDQIARLRRQTRRLLLAYGLGSLFALVLAAVLALGLADYLLRFEDRGVRIIATLALVAVTLLAVYRFVVPILSLRLSDVAIARRVERRFPELQDRLSSAINFLEQPEEERLAGSAELRRAVVAQTTADVENLPWSEAIDTRPAFRVGMAALVATLVAAAIVAIHPSAAWVAVARLAMPFSEIDWPHQNQLAFKNPITRVAIGQDFEVELVDLNGVPPEDAQIVFRYGSGAEPGLEEREAFVELGGSLVARKENVLGPFEYRAIGGDDQTMAWISVEVVEPPAVESIGITLHPPEYTGWPEQASERRIEALRGTRVAIDGRATRHIVAAAIHQEDTPPIALKVADDGHAFALAAADPSAWVIDKSGKYWIELTDSDGLVGGSDDRWDVRAIEDQPPRITFERPIGSLYVTAAASVPITLAAHDDLAIERVVLNYLRSDQSDGGEQIVELYVAATRAVVEPDWQGGVDTGGESRQIQYDWDLAPLGLTPGVQLTMTASATDYRPQSGVSQAVRVVVLTPAEFEDRINARQSAILAEIARILKMQMETRTTTQSLLTQAARVGELRKQDADAGHTAELSQRQIRRSLASPSEGVLAQTAALIDELTANQAGNTEMVRRVEQIQQTLRRLNENELATVEQQLVSVVKTSQLLLEEAAVDRQEYIARIAGSLTAAVSAQDGIIAVLEKLLGELADWSDYRALAREVAEIQAAQSELHQQTEAMQPDTLGRDYAELTNQQQADLQNLARIQAELARRFDALRQRMEQMQEKLQGTAPLAAASLGDAVAVAQKSAIGSDMRDSAQFVETNRLGQSLDRQKTIDAELEQLLDLLSHRPEQSLSRLVKKLRAAEEQLADLRREQQGLRKKIRDLDQQLAGASESKQQEARAELARLAQQQQRLQQQIERLGRELQRLRAEEAAKRMASAGDRTQRGSQASAQGESAKAADLADQTQQDLDEAQRELAARRRQAEQDLANEQLATVEHALAGLASRQESALAETRRLAELATTQGELQPAQVQSLKDLAQNQAQLHDETEVVAEQVSAAEVFQLGVRSAAESMRRAADQLAAEKTGDDVQRAQNQALARLRQLLAALAEGQKAASNAQQQNTQDNGDSKGGANQNRPPPIVHSVTEIKLLTVMQEDVNRRTMELRNQIAGRAADAANAAEAAELASLADEQGRIAALVSKMTARAAAERETATGEGSD
jgi:hypothetical protein